MNGLLPWMHRIVLDGDVENAKQLNAVAYDALIALANIVNAHEALHKVAASGSKQARRMLSEACGWKPA